MAGKFTVSTIFKAVDKMTAPLKRMSNRMHSFTRNAEKGLKSVNRRMGDLQAGIKTVGTTLIASTALITAGLGTATAAGIDFEHTMVSAAAKFPGMIRKGSEEFAVLEQAAMDVGSTTEFTASQAASALNFLAMAGFNAEQSVAALPGVVDLATAANVDLATATDIASDALGAFSLTSKDAQTQAANLARVNDVLATTANTSNTSMLQLFEALKKGGPVATAAGASIEEVAAMAGIMANSGIKAEIAGTAIANSFLNLSKPSTEAEKVMKRLGIQVQDANGSLLRMPDIINNVNAATRDLTKTQRQAAIEVLFGREGLAGTLAVLEAGGEGLRNYQEQLEGATGRTGELAAVMRDTARGDINGLKSAIEGVAIQTFSMANGPFREAVQVMTEWVRVNGDMIAQNVGQFFLDVANNIDAIITAAKVIGTAVAGVWALNTALAAVQGTMALVNLVMAANPIGLAVIAVGALTAAALTLTDSWGKIPEFFQGIWDDIMSIFDAGAAAFTDAVNGLKDAFGFDDDDSTPAERREQVINSGSAAGYGVVSPQERTARSIEERRQTSTTEVTIKDESGRAEVTGSSGPQPALRVLHTGSF